jgi:hypothetical protein
MKELIKQNIGDAGELERLYQQDKSGFKKAFDEVYSEVSGEPVAGFWHERLHFQKAPVIQVTKEDFLFVAILSLLAGFVAKIPDFFSVSPDFFYSRNLGFIVFPFLIAFFVRQQGLDIKKTIGLTVGLLSAVIYMNLLPDRPIDKLSDTLILVSIHMPLLLWMVLGYTFTGNSFNDSSRRLEYLRFNGDLIVMGTIILLAGVLLIVTTMGLFQLININIQQFYIDYVFPWGLASAPIVATYLVQSNPTLVNRVSPIIAKVFTPLVLVTLVVYLFAVLTSGQDPYNDRDFLLIFNGLLIGVMALILFSIAETNEYQTGRWGMMMLTALAVVTVLVNGVALSAIVYRIGEWGFTPNRTAVLGGNLLIGIHLVLVAWNLINVVRGAVDRERVEQVMTGYLPVYAAWLAIVVLLFPVIFGL